MEKKLKILIVDGDVSEAEILESRLQTDFEVAGTAFDGDAADDRWSDPERDPCKDSVFDGCRTGLSDAGEGNRNFVGG